MKHKRKINNREQLTNINFRSYLSFLLNDEVFAIDVTKVLEVLHIHKITRVPQAPDFMRGVMNFRGDILPVVDTRLLFKMPAKSDSERTVVIVLDLLYNNKKMMIGALGDGVKDVINIDPDKIQPVPDVGSKYNIEYLEGMYKHQDKFIMLLSSDKVFSIEALTLHEGLEADFLVE